MREMRDSGVEWIGEIPKDWNCCKQKYRFTLINGRAFKDNEFEEDGTYRILRVGNLFSNPVWYSSSLELEPDKYCEKGDLIYAWSMSYGPYIWNEEKVIYHYHIWKTKLVSDMDKMFSYYYLQALTESIKSQTHETTMGFVTMGIMNNSYIAYPRNIKEQKKISDYLDAKCSKIDEIIEKQLSIIEKLKEYKLSIITEAVTKGLNPDVEMKDSGNIEIGKIPSISRPTKLKYLCNTQGRIGFKGYTTTDLVDEGEGAYTLGASHLNNGKIDLTDPVFISWEKYYESPEIMVKQNDILIVQRGSTIGKVAIVDKNYGEVTINPSLVLINKIHIDSKYLLYALSARYIINYINLIGTTTAIPMISQKQINDLVVIVPPDSIQISVVKYLDEKCGKIDANILKKQKLIDKLQEYKKSLIYEVVTGKKEV